MSINRTLPDFEKIARELLTNPLETRISATEIASELKDTYLKGYNAGKFDGVESGWQEDWDAHYNCMHGGVNGNKKED